ncbi:MAG: hypothetical protein ACF8Q5_01510 [Phycisphaerales bacterium JB040]
MTNQGLVAGTGGGERSPGVLGGVLGVRRRGGAAKGCLIAAATAFVLLVGLVVVGGWWISKNWRGMASGPMKEGMYALVDETPMADSEKGEVKVVIDEFIADFESKAISLEELGLIVEEMESSPLIPAALAQGSYIEYYRDRDDLSDEDKARAELAMDRVARGVFEGTVSNSELVTVLGPIEDTSGTGAGPEMQLGGVSIKIKEPQNCTPEELMAVVANAEAKADEVGVPGEAYEIDVSAELRRVINTALGRPLDAAPTTGNTGADPFVDDPGAGPGEDPGAGDGDDGG